MSLFKLLGELAREYNELKRQITQPVEEALREAVGEVLYRSLTQLPQAKEFEPVDVAELLKRVRSHFEKT
ncbi:hypothetical protein [Pyrobaculum calidifontis]|uniref:hypothetical protein n=1 Tax=Pyrobaculum calidifontis TaxID=181486 RepID=UPI000324F3CA|nr:hypothetical protein [Pyrobaculum calidifontis]